MPSCGFLNIFHAVSVCTHSFKDSQSTTAKEQTQRESSLPLEIFDHPVPSLVLEGTIFTNSSTHDRTANRHVQTVYAYAYKLIWTHILLFSLSGSMLVDVVFKRQASAMPKLSKVLLLLCNFSSLLSHSTCYKCCLNVENWNEWFAIQDF